MDSVNTMLAGYQLAILKNVEAYWLENPPASMSGPAVEVGKEFKRNKDGKLFKVVGGSDNHITLNCDEPSQIISCRVSGKEIEKLFTPERPRSKRPCFQVGWIEERLSNPSRERPCISYYFCWNEKEDGRWLKRKTYVPRSQMSAVWKSCKTDKRTYEETLKLIQKTGKLHHTDSPKL